MDAVIRKINFCERKSRGDGGTIFSLFANAHGGDVILQNNIFVSDKEKKACKFDIETKKRIEMYVAIIEKVL